MPIFTRPLTPEQQEKIKERAKPSQEDINSVANDLIWQLMQRIDKLEKERDSE